MIGTGTEYSPAMGKSGNFRLPGNYSSQCSCEATVFVRGACFAFSALTRMACFQLIGATEELGYKRHMNMTISNDYALQGSTFDRYQ